MTTSVLAAGSPSFPLCHASREEYAAFLRRSLGTPGSVRVTLSTRDRFVCAYPDLATWVHAPLADRIGCVYVGTQLAEQGARLHTIMRVLGHTDPAMSMVYAQISDPEVLRDYQAVLGPGAVIAGPLAEELRRGTLPRQMWTGSRATSSRPSWSSGTACACRRRGRASAIST